MEGPTQRLKVLLFLAFFFGAAGFLFTLLSWGTEYWLLAAESCSQTENQHGGLRLEKNTKQTVDGARIFHEGLFRRCVFRTVSSDFAIMDFWITNQPHSKVCHAAYLFPFPVSEPEWAEPYEQPSAIVFRTFWSIFQVTGVTALTIGGFIVLCAAPLTNQKLYRVGGAFQVCGGVCLLAVVVMYLMWVQVLNTLEQFALHHRASTCPSYHLSVQHGPSFLLAPVGVIFSLLAGLLFVLIGRSVQEVAVDREEKIPESSTTEL
ncbi:transmembrane protein 182-like [Nematolebias whitei]|uniref:transmembrane protein 182-like n=1 Tax=Nematolebias whitei TaxID=451745 RepID=UPI00189A72AE|nr:transmembrane protein 182-like [Nematolebias whitei]